MRIGGHEVGAGHPALVVAEIGVCHNGSLATALEMVDAAKRAGADFVKFQAGDPDVYVTPEKRDDLRATPWGKIGYVEYKRRLELSDDDYAQIDTYCRQVGTPWFVSPLDAGTVDRFERFSLPAYKVASPYVVDLSLLAALRRTGRPVILSTGMSTLEEIDRAVSILDTGRLVILHCTSAYPTRPEEENLRCIETLRERYGVPVGYSGHSVGIPPTDAAVALGACVVERHLTLRRSFAAEGWTSDHAAALEEAGFRKMVTYLRHSERSLGDGIKRVYDRERENMGKFRPAVSSV